MTAACRWDRRLSPISVDRKGLPMCLAIPALVTSVDGHSAEVEVGGVGRRVSIWLTPEARPGDYVLLHTGYAIGIIDEAEAKDTLELLEELVAASDSEAG